MYTLVDFITHVKAIEYILSLTAIAGFLIFWEILKPKPFRTVVNTSKDDLNYIERNGGFGSVMKSVGRIIAGPFIGLLYVVMLPITFFLALAAAAVNLFARMLGKSATFEWRPMEAYLSGKKKKEKSETKDKKG